MAFSQAELKSVQVFGNSAGRVTLTGLDMLLHQAFRQFELITGVAREDWVHVSSSWYHDIAPARELGVNHVWLDREATGAGSSPLSVRVSSGAEIADAIDALVGRAAAPEPMLQVGGPLSGRSWS